MYSSKSVLNQSNISASNISISTIQSIDKMYENTLAVSVSSTTTPWFPYTLDYSLGSIFYIPTNYSTPTNFSIIITNIPTDTTKSYSITLIYYQPINTFYCNSIRCTDTSNTYILGTSTTFGTPLFNGGYPALNNAPNLIMQQFSIVSLYTSGSNGITTRYISSSVSNSY